MSENNNNVSDGLGCVLSALVGLTGLVTVFTLGPIDLGRTVYNQIVGDTPVIKRQLTAYVRSGIIKEHPKYDSIELERRLAQELEIPLVNEGEKVNPQDVGIGTLWDASEDYAKSWWQGWVWPSISDY